MGSQFLIYLLKAGQEGPVMQNILTYLNWLEISLLQILAGPAWPALTHMAASVSAQIFVRNTNIKDMGNILWMFFFSHIF